MDCTDEALYYLDGLDMAYAIPMARQLSLIQTPIQDDPVFIRDETLELMVRLLQGNPLSLLTICPLINLTKKATLQELIFESVPALIPAFQDKGSVFMCELQHICSMMDDDRGVIWRSLTFF